MRGSMRISTFHSLMHRLALVATLALALVPTIGRVARAGAEVDHGAMHHAAAVAQVVVDPHAAHRGHHDAHHAMAEAPPAPPVPAPAPTPHHGDGDCEYCPLLQGLVTPAPVAVVALDAAPPADVARRALPARIDFRHPSGLGSRGPPSIS